MTDERSEGPDAPEEEPLGSEQNDRPKKERGKKERVLHTRVPEVLEQELKRLADGLRVPVSNVVRAILEDAVDTMDVVGRRAGNELRDVADLLSREHTRPRRRDRKRSGSGSPSSKPAAPLEGVVGYQRLILARDEACTLCGAAFERGAEAYLGIRDGAGPRVILGAECLPFPMRENAGEAEAPAKEDES